MSFFRRKVLPVVAYLAFLGVFVEISLQGFYYATAGDFLFRRVGLPVFAPNEYSGLFNRPGMALDHGTQEFEAEYFTNAVGFRVREPGIEYAQGPSDEHYRVMLLGPSFAYGWGVDYADTFGALLERALEAGGHAKGSHVELINAGVPSLPPAPQLRWYEHVGATYAPDLVVQFIYGSMAVSNNPQVGGSVSEDGYLVPKDHSLGRRIRERVKKFATIFYGWVLYTQIDTMLSGDAAEGSGAVLGAGREMSMPVEFDVATPEVREALGYYRDLERVVTASGSELLVVYFPLSYAVHEEDMSRWRHLGVHDVAAQIAFDAAFVSHLNEMGVPTFNATPALQRAAGEGERLYYWLDIHWTPRGNAVTAEAVAAHLLGRQVTADR